jgi:hypothetical protein
LHGLAFEHLTDRELPGASENRAALAHHAWCLIAGETPDPGHRNGYTDPEENDGDGHQDPAQRYDVETPGPLDVPRPVFRQAALDLLGELIRG